MGYYNMNSRLLVTNFRSVYSRSEVGIMCCGGLLDGAGSLGQLGAGLRTEGSRFEPHGRQNTAGALVARRRQNTFRALPKCP